MISIGVGGRWKERAGPSGYRGVAYFFAKNAAHRVYRIVRIGCAAREREEDLALSVAEAQIAKQQQIMNITTDEEETQRLDQKESENAGEQNPPENTLKVRDDPRPISLTGSKDGFVVDETTGSWPSKKELTLSDLRHRIEPWLTALFQSEHLSLLVGSGLTRAVHRLATGSNGTDMTARIAGTLQSQIEAAAKESAKRAGRKEENIEDRIRVANELWRGLDILSDIEVNGLPGRVQAANVKHQVEIALQRLAESVLRDEMGIATRKAESGKSGDRNKALRILASFLMSFASRTGTRDRLNIFTTNYDRLIEEGAELAGLYLLDRFVGNLSPIFRSSRLQVDLHYNPPGIRGEPRYLEGVARFTKLHGSLDWVQAGGDIRRMGLPFGAKSVEPYLNAPGYDGATHHELMIYPNPAKDRETSDYPYAELFRDFAAAICRPNSTLVTYGYSFGDDHINRVIRDMLTIPSTHLVVISFDNQIERIERVVSQDSPQLSLLMGRELADLEKLTTNFLPKAAIDLASARMSQLLNRRYAAQDKGEAQAQRGAENDGGEEE